YGAWEDLLPELQDLAVASMAELSAALFCLTSRRFLSLYGPIYQRNTKAILYMCAQMGDYRLFTALASEFPPVQLGFERLAQIAADAGHYDCAKLFTSFLKHPRLEWTLIEAAGRRGDVELAISLIEKSDSRGKAIESILNALYRSE